MSNIHNKLTAEDKESLDISIYDEEVENAVKQMKKNKSPGPDGIISEFYQIYLHLIGLVFL